MANRYLRLAHLLNIVNLRPSAKVSRKGDVMQFEQLKSVMMILASVALVSSGFVACNKGGDPEVPAPAGPGVTTPPPIQQQCPANQTLYQGQCIDPANLPILNGFFGFYAENYYKNNLNISSSSTWRKFLKEAMGVCGQADHTGGVYACDYWSNSAIDLVIQGGSASNTLRAIFTAWPKTNSAFQYGYALPSIGDALKSFFGFPILTSYSAYRNPLILDMTVSPINDSKGFEARAYGDLYTQANRSLIQLQVAEGKFQDGYFNFRVGYQIGRAHV
mgnify:CR=1 FL=1